MLHIKWRKGFRDIAENKMRSFFVVLAIAVGVFGITVVANSYSILMREMDLNYNKTNPSSSTIWTDYMKEKDINQILSLPYISEVEKRDKIVGRVQVKENEWKDIWLYVIENFSDIRLDTFQAEDGKSIPAAGEILFERKALSFTDKTIGEAVDIKIPSGTVTPLTIVGSVHAPGLAPSWMEGFAYGYITRDTYHMLGGIDGSSELKIKVAGDITDKQHIREQTYKLKSYLEDKGFTVTRIEIPEPGKHPHFSQMASLLFLMEAFGILALLLSGVLVSNMITSLLEKQIRQIGIMKSVGATTFQISALYLGIVAALSCLAMLLAIPLGLLAGRGYALLAASILNFNIYSYSVPSYIFLLEVSAGFFIPVLSSLVPILKSSRITVREALQDYGISQEKYSGRTSDKAAGLIRFLPRPFLLSLRNTFRKKGRLIFTLLVMAVGGTGFITAMNIYSSMYHTVDEKLDAFHYDIEVSFEKDLKIDQIEKELKNISGIVDAEAWGGVSAARVYKDHTTGNSFRVVAPPSDTKLLTNCPLYSGRWLKSSDTNALVINQRILSMEPDLKVGASITLRINQQDTVWKVVGISKELMGLPTAYVNMNYLLKTQNKIGYSNNAVIVTAKHDSISQLDAARQIEQTLNVKGIALNSLVKLSDYKTSLVNHLSLIASFLIIMSLLVVLVGGLGLATTLSVSVMERTKEIGIMRSMGAPSYYITGMIVSEGALIGILSWFISIVFSIPLSRLVCNRFGLVFFEAPLSYDASKQGYLIWLLLVTLFAAAASYNPSRKASLMQINQALYYE